MPRPRFTPPGDARRAAESRADTLAEALIGVRERSAPDGLPCWCPDWLAEDWRVGDGIDDDERQHHDCCVAARAALAAAGGAADSTPDDDAWVFTTEKVVDRHALCCAECRSRAADSTDKT